MILAAFLAVLLGAGVHSPRAAGAESEAFVDTDVLNVRAEPNTSSAIYDQLVWGESVDVYDGPTEDNWYYVGYWGDRAGWVSGDYLGWGAVGGYGAASWNGDMGLSTPAWVDTDALNVRGSASTDGEVLDLVTFGDQITVIGDEVNGYLPISHWSGHGWVWAGYLTYGGAPTAQRWIDVDRSSSLVTLYEGDAVVASFWGAMGRDQSDFGFFATANGTYYVFSKVRGLTWTDWGQVYIEDWVGFDPFRQNGFHTYSLDENGKVLRNGDGPTGGCIALEPGAAEFVYDFASIGTRVEVHW